MRCRRCARELPEDSTHCEYCGTYQKSYIAINTDRVDKKSQNKVILNAIIFIVLAILISAVVIVSSTMSENTRKTRLEDIRALYEQLLTEDAPDKSTLDKFNVLVGQYVVKYPKSDAVAEVEKYHAEINGYDPELANSSDLKAIEDALKNEQHLIETAKSTILQIGDISAQKRGDSESFDLIIKWANNSQQNIDSVVFLVEAHDAGGNIINNSEGKGRLAASADLGPFAPSSPDAYYQNIWVAAYPPGSEIASVKLLRVTVNYENGTKITLNENVSQHLK